MGVFVRDLVSIRICVAILSEPIACLSFKFQWQVAQGLNPGPAKPAGVENDTFEKKVFFVNFSIFH